MQETAKVNYIQYGKSTKGKKGKKPPQSGAGDKVATGALNLVEKVRSLPFPLDTPLQMWERQIPKGTGLQSCGCNMQRMWKERTL